MLKFFGAEERLNGMAATAKMAVSCEAAGTASVSPPTNSTLLPVLAQIDKSLINTASCLGGIKETSAAATDRDVFVNYILRAANFRGGVKRGADERICASEKLDFAAALTEIFSPAVSFTASLSTPPTSASALRDISGRTDLRKRKA